MKKIYKYWPLVIVALFSLTPIVWFLGKGNVLISGVDTNFPLDPIIWFQRRFFVWNAISNAGSDFSSSTAGLFFHIIQVVPYKLGLNLSMAQITSLIFWFSAIVCSAYILARVILPKKLLVQLLFVALYSYNIYLFNTWENVKVANLSLVASIPLTITILLLLYQKTISYGRAGVYSVISGIILSGTGINPAYFISFMLVVLLFSIGQTSFNFTFRNALDRLKDTVFVMVLILLVNMFWILPTVEFILRAVPSNQSLAEIGFTNWLIGLSENTSLLNVLRLQGLWDWYAFDPDTREPLYIPYVSNYFYNLPFVFFSFLIPLLAILSFIFYDRRKKYLYSAFGLMFIAGTFLGAGAHPPTGGLFLWFTSHIPFFSLFRSPWYIFTPLLTLSFAGLVSLFFYNLDTKIRKEKQDSDNCLFLERSDKFKLWLYLERSDKFKLCLFSLIVAMFISATLLYSYPLIRGDIFRPKRADGFYVEFPSYVFEAQRWLTENGDGRIISFPDENMETFEWGYRGIDSVLGLLVDREVLFMPFQGDDHSVARLIREFFLNLRKGQLEAAGAIAGKLNVGLVFMKKDQIGWSDDLPALVSKFNPQIFGKWHFIPFPDKEYLPKIFSPEKLFMAYPYIQGDSMLPVLNGRSALLHPKDSVVNSLPNVIGASGKVILAENSQVQSLLKFEVEPGLKNRLGVHDLSQVIFTFEIPSGGTYQPLLERYRLEDFGIDITKNLDIELDGEPSAWNIVDRSDSFVRFAPLNLTEGYHEVSVKLLNQNLIRGGGFDGAPEFIRGGEGRDFALYEVIGNGTERFLSILNTTIADASADWNISPFDPLADYYIEVRYKQIYGKDAKVLTTQLSDFISKNQVEHLPNYPEWRVFSFYFRPQKAESKLDIKLVASTVNDPLGTKVAYDDLKVKKVFSNKLLLVGQGNDQLLASPKFEFRKASPVLYEGKIKDADKPHIIVFSENYSSQWEFTAFNMDGVKLNLAPPHFSANLYANAWYLENTPEEYKFQIYYRPQRLFWLGLIISGVSAILSVVAMVFFGGEKKCE